MTLPGPNWLTIKDELQIAVNDGDKESGIEITRKSLEGGIVPTDFFLQAIQPVLRDVGKRFERLEIFLPEMMRSAKVVEEIHNQVLKPALQDLESDVQKRTQGTIVIGTVKGDLHDLGKKIVALMLEVNGYEVYDLGIDVGPKKFIEEAQIRNADIIAMSSLLTPSMPYMRDVLELLKGMNLRDKFYVVVGGAPVTLEYTQKIGADGYGDDAIKAVEICNQLMKVQM